MTGLLSGFEGPVTVEDIDDVPKHAAMEPEPRARSDGGTPKPNLSFCSSYGRQEESGDEDESNNGTSELCTSVDGGSFFYKHGGPTPPGIVVMGEDEDDDAPPSQGLPEPESPHLRVDPGAAASPSPTGSDGRSPTIAISFGASPQSAPNYSPALKSTSLREGRHARAAPNPRASMPPRTLPPHSPLASPQVTHSVQRRFRSRGISEQTTASSTASPSAFARLSMRAQSLLRRGPVLPKSPSSTSFLLRETTPEDVFTIVGNSTWVDNALECLAAVMSSPQYTNVLAPRYLASLPAAERRSLFQSLLEQRLEVEARIAEKRAALESMQERQLRLQETGSTYELDGLVAEMPNTQGQRAQDSVETMRSFFTGLVVVGREDLEELTDLQQVMQRVTGDGDDFPPDIPDVFLLDCSYGVKRCIANRCTCGRFANQAVDVFYSVPCDLLTPADWVTRCLIEVHEVLNVCKQSQTNVLEEKDGTPTELTLINKSIRAGLSSADAYQPRSLFARLTLAQIYAQSVRAAIVQLRRFASVLEVEPALLSVTAGSAAAPCPMIIQSCIVSAVYEGRVIPAMANVCLANAPQFV